MKLIITIFFILFTSSCGSKQQQAGWTDENKKEYHSSCVEFSKASFDNDEKKTSNYCDCVLSKVISKYPDYNMVLRMSPAEKEKYFFICK